MNIKKHFILVCAAAGFSSAVLLANAHEQVWSGCKSQINKEECRQEQHAKFQAAREKRWHDELKITPEQEPAWVAFTTSSHQQRGLYPKRHQKLHHAEVEKISAPERLERRLIRMEKHQKILKTKLTALKKLYNELTPEQQMILNKRMTEFEHKRHHRHWERGGIKPAFSSKADQPLQ